MESEYYRSEKSRKPIPDLLKGMAILTMVQVHVMEVLANPVVFDGLAGRISLFLGGPFAAPVFLSIMGYFLAASRKMTMAKLRRGIYLILLGLLLNLGMNFNLLLKIIAGSAGIDPWRFVFGVDILVNAGLGILLIVLAESFLHAKTGGYLLVAIAIPFLGLLDPAAGKTVSWYDYARAFFIGSTEWSYFPVIPWTAYVFLGYAFHRLEKLYPKVMQRLLQARYLLMPALVILLFASGGIYIDRIIRLQEYYHHGPGLFAWIGLFLITWLMIAVEAERAFGTTRFFLWLKWMGKNVTAIYVVQWLIIGNIGTELFRTQFLFPSLLWFLVVTAVTCLLVYAGKKLYLSLMQRTLKA